MSSGKPHGFFDGRQQKHARPYGVNFARFEYLQISMVGGS
jgi:hypothetical protein